MAKQAFRRYDREQDLASPPKLFVSIPEASIHLYPPSQEHPQKQQDRKSLLFLRCSLEPFCQRE